MTLIFYFCAIVSRSVNRQALQHVYISLVLEMVPQPSNLSAYQTIDHNYNNEIDMSESHTRDMWPASGPTSH